MFILSMSLISKAFAPDSIFGRDYRLLWIYLSHLWRDWRSALDIVKSETVVAWHRAGFRLFWTWKVRRGQRGRPVILREVRDLVRKMCWENPGWGVPRGVPRIHGELLKLGINIGLGRHKSTDRRCPSVRFQ
jgi:putative transposase